MKLSSLFMALVAAQDGIDGDHHLNGMGQDAVNEVINEANIRADGQQGSNRAQVTRAPTAAPKEGEDAFANHHAGTCEAYVPTTHTAVVKNGPDGVLAKKWSVCIRHEWEYARCCEEGFTCYQKIKDDGTLGWGTCRPDGDNELKSNGELLPGITPYPAHPDISGVTPEIAAQLGVECNNHNSCQGESKCFKKRKANGDWDVKRCWLEHNNNPNNNGAMPTAYPTAFPTKNLQDKGTTDRPQAWEIIEQKEGDSCCIKYKGDGVTCKTWGMCDAENVCKARITGSGHCIEDQGGRYDDLQMCKFKFNGIGPLKVMQFDTEPKDGKKWTDIMKIDNKKYAGSDASKFEGMEVGWDTTFLFQSDDADQQTEKYQGFKFCINPQSKGTTCKAPGATKDGKLFERPVGWAGAGPGKDFCNLWKCEPKHKANGKSNPGDRAYFKKSQKDCSVEQSMDEGGYQFCSHTTCNFKEITDAQGKTHKVIQVHSDHREEHGGNHTCGLSRHPIHGNQGTITEGRPVCDCLCRGARRQDANTFKRKMHHLERLQTGVNPGVTGAYKQYDGVGNTHRVVAPGADNSLDRTMDANDFDAEHNSNNFYSQHTNKNKRGDLKHHFANENYNTASNGDGTTTGLENFDTGDLSQYNDKDHTYNGQTVAHMHRDT